MAKQRPCTRAAMLLPLMALSQVQQSNASPVRPILHHRAETVTTTDCPPGQRRPPPTPQIVSGIDYAAVQPPSEPSNPRTWQPSSAIAWQIGDGQVQAYTILTADPLAPSNDQTTLPIPSTNTPVPRDWTAPTASDWRPWESQTGWDPWDGRPSEPPHNGGRPNGSPWGGGTAGDDDHSQTLSSPSEVLKTASMSFEPPTPFPTPAITTSISGISTQATATSSPASAPSSAASVTLASSSSSILPPTEASTSASGVVPLSSAPDSALTSLSPSDVQTVTGPPPSGTSGVIMSSLETSGNPATQPFPSLLPNTTRSLSLVDTATLSNLGPTATASKTAISANDIFQPIASGAPPAQITQRSDHPVPRLGIQQQQQRLQTNKFYANLFLGDQTNAVWTHPYSLSWSAGGSQTGSYGIAVSHIERNQIPGGLADESDRAQWGFFAAPLGIQSLVLSAAELVAGTTLTTDTLEAFSVNANLLSPGSSVPVLTMPLVQGMGFVTANYNNGTPLIETGLGVENLTYIGDVHDNVTFKYRAILRGGSTWLLYITPSRGQYNQNSFTLLNATRIQGPSGFAGIIQVAKVPVDSASAEDIYDSSAGAYAAGATISGSMEGTTGSYTLSWSKAGTVDQDLLMFALPHHVESFSTETARAITDLQLVTTTKGFANATRGDSWSLVEPDLPVTMGFNPWTPARGDISTLPQAAIEAINIAGDSELRESVANQSNVGSMYYDGKALAKFAAIVYVLHELADNVTLALTGLQQLQSAFDLHVSNLQTFPLVYDTQWGGVVSVSTYLSGNNGDDFGNTWYNDHHFHYGYFVYAAAIIGYLDPTWLDQGTNKAYINTLVRDYANSIPDDEYYPFSRNFDWYNGHSWAKGLFPSADGKDQESSSEDTMASLAVKMWGRTINDKNMEARGNLMLGIQARSLSKYYLYTSDNVVEPAEYIGNKVAGILFDNKCDHTTYFGNSIEFIQGIHMLPLLPMSAYIRSKTFVQQEWNAYDLSNYAPTVQSGWRGVLVANQAIIDPQTSYNFFSNVSGDFTLDMLDGGASQTWYLAWSAALGSSGY